MQFIFINGRPVQNKTISFHLNDVYRLLLSRGVYPFFCAYLTLPPSEVDVNVHPTKREVKLKDETVLVASLRRFAEQILMTHSKAKQITPRPFAAHYPAPLTHLSNTQQSLSLQENILLFKMDGALAEQKDTLRERLQQSRYLGNLLKKYLLFETPGSLLVIDQHAAQERITFEKLKAQIEKGSIEIQALLTPILLPLTAQEILLWEENKEGLERIGFSSSLFDPRTLAIHSHPQLITQPETSVRNLLAGGDVRRMDPSALARLACRSSVMAGTQMNKEQAEYQRTQLLLCSDPFTCPHARPTVIEISQDYLNKNFLRG